LGFFDRFTRQPTTIRWSLIRNITLLILLSGAAILAATLWFARGTVETLSRTLIQRTMLRTAGELRSFFSLPEANLRMARRWGQSGMYTGGDLENLNQLYIPVMETCPQVSSVMVANEAGLEHLILRKQDGWLVRIVRADDWGQKAHWFLYDKRGRRIKDYWTKLDYDPRKRPWFKGARKHKATQHPFWTRPYTFFTTKDPGITAAMTWKPPGENVLPHVVGYDLLLTDISQFTTHMEVSRHGKAFVLTDRGRMVGLPADQRYKKSADQRSKKRSDQRFNTDADPANPRDAVKAAVLKPAAALGIPEVTAAVAAWKQKQRKPGCFTYESGDKRWWAGFRKFRVGPHRNFWIAVVVPESDFTAEINRQRNIIVGIIILAVLVAVALAFWLARRYSRPLEALARQSQRIRELDLTASTEIVSSLAEVRRLAASQEQMRSALESFARYVPIEVVRELVRRGEVARIGGKIAPITILFSDVRGFTTISESMSPDELADHMAEYFALLLEVLHEHRATVDKFIGDAILAFWGAPAPDSDAPIHAVQAALECTQKLDAYNQQWRAAGRIALPTCFGIHSGEVVVGNIGAPSRLSYTVLGDAVNLASRLEALNRLYGTSILVSEQVATQITTAYHLRLVDRVAVKGKSDPVRVYEVLGATGKVAQTRLDFAATYERAFALYQEQKFAEAADLLESLSPDCAKKTALSVKRLVELCHRLKQDPPGPDWDGVVRLKKK
jgi:adenylate cyclase